MKALVVGYGSMGRRRIRLLKKIMSDVEIITVDANPERLKQARTANVTAYANLDDAIAERPDFSFVSTSPAAHADIALHLAKAGINLFTELNLIDKNYDEITAAAKANGSVAFMSSTMLYDKRIHKIQELVAKTTPPPVDIYFSCRSISA